MTSPLLTVTDPYEGPFEQIFKGLKKKINVTLVTLETQVTLKFGNGSNNGQQLVSRKFKSGLV